MVTMVTPFSALPERLFGPEAGAGAARIALAWSLLDSVADPEIPVISVRELGIIRAVRSDGARIEVDVTPTYSGCPATEVIAADIRTALEKGGFADVSVRTVLSPPWATSDISENGLAKLKAYGIAPPGAAGPVSSRPIRFARSTVACPRCGSADTERIAEFGSTACKALYRCRACREPFDYFKPF